jgi:site-specific recombinase XerC
MVQLPPHLFSQYRSFCADNGVNGSEFADHLKWVRYFLDFCEKYQVTGDDAERTESFLDKLRQKGQSEQKRQQAGKAVSLYFDMIRGGVDRQTAAQHAPTEQRPEHSLELPARTPSSVVAAESFYNVAGYQEKSRSPEWDEVMGRLFECLQLRVRDFNFDAGILTVHGKGKKDRTLPLPESIVDELHKQMRRVKALHEKDLAEGYDGVFLDDAVERKFTKAPKELLHQWFIPQKDLTLIAESGQRRRWHIHESNLQKALFLAVRKAGITKRVTAHTFRHSYATHLLQANYDIRTIQTKLGHSSLKTTMIYTHCVPVRTVKEARSPLDF